MTLLTLSPWWPLYEVAMGKCAHNTQIVLLWVKQNKLSVNTNWALHSICVPLIYLSEAHAFKIK